LRAREPRRREVLRELRIGAGRRDRIGARGAILFQIGRHEEAAASIDEILAMVDPEPVMDWAWWIVPAAVVLSGIGRAEEILALGGGDLPSPWVMAARRWSAGDLSGAADLFDEIGSAGDEATARAKEAERLIAAGRRPEAEPFLSRALDLYRGMGATAFMRDAERLLAAPA
jgi:tetratricopeptide (TPR) repeat protein